MVRKWDDAIQNIENTINREEKMKMLYFSYCICIQPWYNNIKEVRDKC